MRHRKTPYKPDRQVPARNGLNAMRDYIKYGSQTLAAGFLAMASSNIGKEDIEQQTFGWEWTGNPDTSQTTHLEAQEKAFEEAYGNLHDHLHVEIISHTLIEHTKVNTRYGNPDALGPYAAFPVFAEVSDDFYIILSRGIADKTIGELKGSIQGEIKNFSDLEAEFFLLGMGTAENFRRDDIGQAASFNTVALDDNQQVTVVGGCSMYSVPFHMDINTFTREITYLEDHSYVVDIENELSAAREFVNNHELAHCVTALLKSHDFIPEERPVWFNEAIADLYATARHIQVEGDDGFAEKVIAMREVGAWPASYQSDMGHYSVPVLRRALPFLKEAAEKGELEGKDPYELMEFIGTKVFQNPEEPDVLQNITDEHTTRQHAYTALYEGIDLMEEDSPDYQKMLESFAIKKNDVAAALDEHQEARALVFKHITDQKDREHAYENSLHSSMQEMLNSQPDINQAYTAAAYKVYLVEREIDALQNISSISEQQALSEPGASGLPRERELDIYRAYQSGLEAQIAQAAEQKKGEKAPEKDTHLDHFPGS